ncbi:MAG: asparagine synthase (glutamine-hydrolyzing) [Pelagibacteraceae bacterium]|nr:asparagine synthase (glutamine-hydrolyzing) [Pelagibacteraceae bacterium]
MCGILGIIHNRKYNLSNNEFKKINQQNFNRGPDNQGIENILISNKFVKLGHSRLSILDLSKKANQPMYSSSERFIISFNGEIYNHLDLRKILNQKKNIKWKTTSDTETLLNLFENYSNQDVLKKIEGMFAFILLDKKENKILVARDIAGEKPLYFCFNNLFTAFASDLKTLTKIPQIKKDIDGNSVQKYLEYNYIPSPNTIYKNIFKLHSASYILLDLNKFTFENVNNYNQLNTIKGIENKKWWNLDFKRKNSQNNNINYYEEKISYELKKSVKQQLISDVPLGAFLSAGIDSSLIVSLMQEFNNKTKTFNIGFEENDYDESYYSKEIAKILSTDHTSYIFTENDILNTIQTTSYAYSEPFADSSQLPTLIVSKLAKEKVKVVLTGDGGDELFGGYNRYIYANRFWKKLNILNPKIRNFIVINLLSLSPMRLLTFLGKRFNLNLNPSSIRKIILKLKSINSELTYYHALTQEWTSDTNILINNHDNKNSFEIEKIFKLNNYLFEEKMMIADFFTYLPDDILCKVDRATMHYSLESRAPFLNKSLIENSFDIPLKYKINKGNSKIILRNLLKKYIPEKLIDKPKKGFGVPIGKMMRGSLKSWTNDILSKNRCSKHGFFDFNIVENEKNNHFNNITNNQYKLWSLIQFNEWFHNVHMQK